MPSFLRDKPTHPPTHADGTHLVAKGRCLEDALGALARLAEPGNDRHRMDLLVDELLGLAEELPGEHDDRGGPVADLVVLHLGDI